MYLSRSNQITGRSEQKCTYGNEYLISDNVYKISYAKIPIISHLFVFISSTYTNETAYPYRTVHSASKK